MLLKWVTITYLFVNKSFWKVISVMNIVKKIPVAPSYFFPKNNSKVILKSLKNFLENFSP